MVYVKEMLLRGRVAIYEDVIFGRLLRNSAWLLSASSIGIIVSFFQGVLVARILGVELFGVLGVIMTFVQVVNQLTSFRMREFVVKYVSDALGTQNLRQAAAIIKFALLVEITASFLAFGIILVLAPIGVRWFVTIEGGQELIVAYAIVILGNLAAETSTGILEVFNLFATHAIITTVAKVVSLMIICGVFFLQNGLWGVMLAYLIANGLSGLLLLLNAIQVTKQQLGVGWWRTSLQQINGQWYAISRFVLSTNISSTLSLVTRDSDLLWLSYLRNPTEVGYYKLAYTLATMVFVPVAPLMQTIYREISWQAAQSQWHYYRQLLRKGSLLSATYISLVMLLCVLFAPWLIYRFYGQEYEPVIPALFILLIGMGFAQVFFWARPSLLALGHADYAMKVNILIAVLKIVGIMSLVRNFGYLGNAILLTVLYVLGVSFMVKKTYALIHIQRNIN